VAADLWGDLLGRALTPFALWTGILAGPIAWALDLTISYALVKPVCAAQTNGLLRSVPIGSFLLTAVGAWCAFRALAATADVGPTDGGSELQRARFMALLGLAISALFAVQVGAGAIPRWVLDACS
jgi:hypothetical protein